MKKILLVEDDALMMKIIIKILSNEDYEIIPATNGKEAFEKLNGTDYSFDLVITDIMMPYSNGFEIVSKIKEHSKNRVPVLMISVENHEEIVMEVFKVGADDYLKKPIMAGELLIRVKRLLN